MTKPERSPNDEGAGGVREESPKRILWAFLLCFTICAHRVYAGRYVSGILQMAWMWGAGAWACVALKGLVALANTPGQDMLTLVQNMADWEAEHAHAVAMPAFAMIAVGIWVAVDAGLLLGGKFKDGQGRRMTRWV